MFTIPETTTADSSQPYDAIALAVAHLIEGERDAIANMANAASMLYHTLDACNWVGFYRFDQSELVLGPFHGKPACIRIAMGRGVCGTAAASQQTIVVPDVHAFPGHIACDAASRSEIVVPMVLNERLLGVLDLDSPISDRFTSVDARGLEAIAQLLIAGCDW